jgi:hypothetical protein
MRIFVLVSRADGVRDMKRIEAPTVSKKIIISARIVSYDTTALLAPNRAARVPPPRTSELISSIKFDA